MKRSDAGFAIVEALIGSAIIAVTLVAMYGAIVESAARNRMAEARRMAMLIAQSQMSAIGATIPAVPGITEGTEGNFYWRVDIEPYNDGPPRSPVGQLCKATVVVENAHRAPLANLDTLILARGT